MIRRAFTMRLKPDSLAEYKYHHDHLWPELASEIANSGIATITTFQRDLDLFLISEIHDEQAWDKLWNSEVHKRWAEVMQPLMHLREDGIVDAGELTEIFHHSAGEANTQDAGNQDSFTRDGVNGQECDWVAEHVQPVSELTMQSSAETISELNSEPTNEIITEAVIETVVVTSEPEPEIIMAGPEIVFVDEPLDDTPAPSPKPKRAGKKAAAKKPAAKKAAAKKSAGKKPAAKKSAPKKSAPKKSAKKSAPKAAKKTKAKAAKKAKPAKAAPKKSAKNKKKPAKKAAPKKAAAKKAVKKSAKQATKKKRK